MIVNLTELSTLLLFVDAHRQTSYPRMYAEDIVRTARPVLSLLSHPGPDVTDLYGPLDALAMAIQRSPEKSTSRSVLEGARSAIVEDIARQIVGIFDRARTEAQDVRDNAIAKAGDPSVETKLEQDLAASNRVGRPVLVGDFPKREVG